MNTEPTLIDDKNKIPSRLKDGRANPEYVKQYHAKRIANGNPVKRLCADAEYQKEYRRKRKENGNPIKSQTRTLEQQRAYRKKRKEQGNPIKSTPTLEQLRKYRASAKGKAATKRYNESEKGKAARSRYNEKNKKQGKPRDVGDKYADRIIRDAEMYARRNKGFLEWQ